MLIDIDRISYGWPGQESMFKNLSLSLDNGEIVAVLGPNGAGKTTLLKTIMGFLPLKEGEIKFSGGRLEETGMRNFWQQVSYVPQAKSPAFGLTCFDMVLLGRNPHISFFSAPRKDDLSKAKETFKLLDIDYLRNKYVNSISGGELQMILLARALVREPKLIILDEPESNLDFRNQLKILQTLKFLSEEKRIACIFNTHYPEHASRIADKALLLGRAGRWKFGKVEMMITENNLQLFFEVVVKLIEVEDHLGPWKAIIPMDLIESQNNNHLKA